MGCTWEQCPRCESWNLEAFVGKEVACGDCHECGFWYFGPKEQQAKMRQTTKDPLEEIAGRNKTNKEEKQE